MCGRYVTEEDTSIDMGALYRELNLSYPNISLKSGEIYPTNTVPLICGTEQMTLPGTWGYPGSMHARKALLKNQPSETDLSTIDALFLRTDTMNGLGARLSTDLIFPKHLWFI